MELLSVIILFVWVVAVQRCHASYAFLAGALLSLATFFSLGNGALLLVLVIYALWYFWHEARERRGRKQFTEETKPITTIPVYS